MHEATKTVVVSTINILKSIYRNQEHQLAKKLENIGYINIENLVSTVEKEIPADQINVSYDKIVAIIESIIQD